ncbi:MAG: bifunctional [glutamate--ammonia ligase]-adenylyl-L-tyrosine phosphorylase/[glutamate--ammonia-ligase] adenylyltransferase, partial [Chromatiales bacterium]
MAREELSLDALPGETPRVWSWSPFVAKACARYPGQLVELLRDGDLSRAYGDGELRGRVERALADVQDEDGLLRHLRLLRNREMLRIAWRDLAGMAELSETLGDITDLAEHCVDVALSWLSRHLIARYGTPRSRDGAEQGLLVLGMGKLGGRELNFSSDIDLVFAYPDDGVTDGERALDNQQFFTKLGQRLIKALGQITSDGFVFRVDMRLRPFGDSGPLVMSFDALEHYYETHGREWERYALIKARVIAGDREAGDALCERLRPFVYRRYLDYGVFASLRDMKALINRESERKGLVDNIKLGPGGIREVEFIGQVFQLIRGGRDPALQVRGIRLVLARLAERDLLPDYAEQQLQQAYVFLRRVENRLQMADDQQTHALPGNELGRLRLADAMGYSDWAAFRDDLDGHMRHVHEQFGQVFGAPQVDEGHAEPRRQDLVNLWYGTLSRETAQALLQEAGYAEPGPALEALDAFREGRVVEALSHSGRERLDHLMPLLIGAVGGCERPHVTLARVLDLLSMIARRTVYLSLLTESPMALSQLVRLCAASPWIASHLAKHPLLLDGLLDPRTLYTPLDRAALREALAAELEQVDPDDLEQVMDRLR